MASTTLSYRICSEGQIALDCALFCLECDLIFAGTVSCPRCASEAVWPLSEWVQPIRSGGAVSKRENDMTEDTHSENDARAILQTGTL
jgi:hypothetical protein